MAQQTINIGAAPDDGTGDPIRSAFNKTNANFTELYGASTGGSVPVGGTAGQVLSKIDATDFNTEWTTPAAGSTQPFELIVACSDETTGLSTGAAKTTFRMPDAVTLTAVRASLTTAQMSGSTFTIDINEAGTSILSTKLTIDNTERTSTTAAVAAVISDTALADDAEMSVDIDQIGDGTAKGLKITLIGTRT